MKMQAESTKAQTPLVRAVREALRFDGVRSWQLRVRYGSGADDQQRAMGSRIRAGFVRRPGGTHTEWPSEALTAILTAISTQNRGCIDLPVLENALVEDPPATIWKHPQTCSR